MQSRDSFSANQNAVNLTGIRDDRQASGAKEESIEEVQRLVVFVLQTKNSNKKSSIQIYANAWWCETSHSRMY